MDRALPAAERDPWLGSHLGGKYRIDGVLGHGGTGHVYRAIQEPMGRPVAVKVLRLDLPPEEQRAFEIRFLREASQAGALQHPNVVTVHDFGRADDGTCFIVMEMLRGRSLKDVLREGPLQAPRALELFDQIVRGLRAAHVAGLVHRDVKPGNIFLVPGDEGQDRVKLLDFGLVKDLDAGSAAATEPTAPGEPLPTDDAGTESTITRHGLFLGTPHYVAPEQARGGTVDGRSDLYSAGVVLYRMVTGKLPYYDRNPTLMALAHIQQPYPPMAERAPEVSVPDVVEAMVRRCMEKDPQDRFADADALLVEIARARHALAAPPVEATPSTLSSEVLPLPSPPPPVRRLPWVGALAVLALAGVAGAVALALWAHPAPVVAALAQPAVAVAPPVSTRTVTLSLSSEPSGATVWLGDQRLGVTPMDWPVPVEGPAEQRVIRFEAEGRVPYTETVTLDAPSVFVRGALPSASKASRPSARAESPRSAPAAVEAVAPAAPVAALAVVPSRSISADGVAFTLAEAAATVSWLNGASHDALYGAGIAGRQVKIIEDGRPWSDITGFAATPQIGEKTVAAARDAAR